VCGINFDDGIMSVIGTDQQFYDIERFCACIHTHSSVLGIVTTFNLGDFYVTPTVYEHKLVVNKITGKHPVFVGPALIHQDRIFGTYFYFASQMKKIRTKLDQLVAFGTDGDEGLSSAFSSVYPSSVHLLYSIHKHENIIRKLREYCVSDKDSKQILHDRNQK
jgi:hypothetical protein